MTKSFDYNINGLITRISLLICALLSFASANSNQANQESASNKKLNIIIPHKFGIISNDDRTGFGDLFYQEFNSTYPEYGNFRYLPSARAIREMQNHNGDCFVGSDKHTYKLYLKKQGVESDAFISTHYVLVTLKERPTISSTKELTPAMKIAAINGVDPSHMTGEIKQILQRKSTEFVPGQDNLLKMLRAKRVDGILINIGVNQTFKDLHFDPNFPLLTIDRAIVCHQGINEVEDFFRKANPIIKKIKSDGAFSNY